MALISRWNYSSLLPTIRWEKMATMNLLKICYMLCNTLVKLVGAMAWHPSVQSYNKLSVHPSVPSLLHFIQVLQECLLHFIQALQVCSISSKCSKSACSISSKCSKSARSISSKRSKFAPFHPSAPRVLHGWSTRSCAKWVQMKWAAYKKNGICFLYLKISSNLSKTFVTNAHAWQMALEHHHYPRNHITGVHPDIHAPSWLLYKAYTVANAFRTPPAREKWILNYVFNIRNQFPQFLNLWAHVKQTDRHDRASVLSFLGNSPLIPHLLLHPG